MQLWDFCGSGLARAVTVHRHVACGPVRLGAHAAADVDPTAEVGVVVQ